MPRQWISFGHTFERKDLHETDCEGESTSSRQGIESNVRRPRHGRRGGGSSTSFSRHIERCSKFNPETCGIVSASLNFPGNDVKRKMKD